MARDPVLENSRGRFAWPSPNSYDGSGPNKRVAGRCGDVIDNKRVQRRTRAVTFEVVNLPRVPADPKRSSIEVELAIVPYSKIR